MMSSTNPEVQAEAARLIKHIKDELVWEVREQSVRLEAIRAYLSMCSMAGAARCSDSYMEGMFRISNYSRELDEGIKRMLCLERQLNVELIEDYNNPKETT